MRQTSTTTKPSRRPAGGKKVSVDPAPERNQRRNAAVARKTNRARRGGVAVVAIGLSALLITGPFFRGLFFTKEQLVALIFALGLFAFWWWQKYRRSDGLFMVEPIEYAGAALVVAYLISTLVALNVRSAVQEVAKNLLYFLVLWLTLETTKSNEDRKRVLTVIFAAGTLLALFGIANAAGMFNFRGAFGAGRISSSLQYPNALAAFLTVSTLLGATLGAVEDRVWRRLLYAAGTVASLLAFVFTYSRASWLLYPVAALGLILVAPATYRLRLALGIAFAGVAAGIASPIFSAGIRQFSGTLVWGATTLAAALAVAGEFAREWFLGRTRRSQFIVAGAVAVLFLALIPFGIRRLPKDLVHRLASISLQDESIGQRLQFSADALKIVRDYPILGTGGGGFDATYQAYQSYGYVSSQVHNHFIQTLVETGVVGFAAFIALWVAAIYAYITAVRRADPITATLAGGSLVLALTMGVNGWMDFNLSLSAVSLVLWTLWAVVVSVPRSAHLEVSRSRGGFRRAPAVPATVAMVSAISIAVFAGRLLAGSFTGDLAQLEMKLSPQAAQTMLAHAIAEDPFDASYRVDLGQTEFLLAKTQKNDQLAHKAQVDVRKGLHLNSTNASYETIYGAMALQLGSVDEGLNALERAVADQPFVPSRYEELAKAYVEVGKYYLGKGQREQAMAALDKVPSVLAQLAARHRQVLASSGAWMPIPETTSQLQLLAGEALVLEGKADAAQPFLVQAAGDPAWTPDADLWLGILAERNGDVASAQGLLNSAYAKKPPLRDDYATIVKLLK